MYNVAIMLVGVQTFNTQSFFSDTDSLLYKVETADPYTELATKNEDCKDFDFSNCPEFCPLYYDANQRRVLNLGRNSRGITYFFLEYRTVFFEALRK